MTLFFTVRIRSPSQFPVREEENEIKCVMVFLLTVLGHRPLPCFAESYLGKNVMNYLLPIPSQEVLRNNQNLETEGNRKARGT